MQKTGPEEGPQGPIRSKYRGLSWDKKYQGWRVRVYYAGKQRHVGRYEDEVTAAKAYDKAVVCLYGGNAITNFGLEQCLADPTEVSTFIIQAKEKAEQEQHGRAQQQLLHQPSTLSSASAASSPHVQTVLQNGRLLSPQLVAYQPNMQQQQQLLFTSMDPMLRQQQQLLAAGGMAVATDSLPQQFSGCTSQDGRAQRMLPPVDGPYLLMSSPMAETASTSTTSCTTSASGLSSSNSAASSSTASSYMLCSTASGQTLVLPIVSPAAPTTNGYITRDGSFVLQQAQQQLLFMEQQEPLQLSVQPQLTTLAGHMSTAATTAVAGGGLQASASMAQQQQQQLLLQQQQFLQQQLQGLMLLDSMSYQPGFTMGCCAGNSNTALPSTDGQQTAGAAGSHAAAGAAVPGLAPAATLGLMLPQVARPGGPCIA